MKTQFKKVLGIALTICMLATLVTIPVSVSAASDFNYVNTFDGLPNTDISGNKSASYSPLERWSAKVQRDAVANDAAYGIVGVRDGKFVIEQNKVHETNNGGSPYADLNLGESYGNTIVIDFDLERNIVGDDGSIYMNAIRRDYHTFKLFEVDKAGKLYTFRGLWDALEKTDSNYIMPDGKRSIRVQLVFRSGDSGIDSTIFVDGIAVATGYTDFTGAPSRRQIDTLKFGVTKTVWDTNQVQMIIDNLRVVTKAADSKLSYLKEGNTARSKEVVFTYPYIFNGVTLNENDVTVTSVETGENVVTGISKAGAYSLIVDYETDNAFIGGEYILKLSERLGGAEYTFCTDNATTVMKDNFDNYANSAVHTQDVSFGKDSFWRCRRVAGNNVLISDSTQGAAIVDGKLEINWNPQVEKETSLGLGMFIGDKWQGAYTLEWDMAWSYKLVDEAVVAPGGAFSLVGFKGDGSATQNFFDIKHGGKIVTHKNNGWEYGTFENKVTNDINTVQHYKFVYPANGQWTLYIDGAKVNGAEYTQFIPDNLMFFINCPGNATNLAEHKVLIDNVVLTNDFGAKPTVETVRYVDAEGTKYTGLDTLPADIKSVEVNFGEAMTVADGAISLTNAAGTAVAATGAVNPDNSKQYVLTLANDLTENAYTLNIAETVANASGITLARAYAGVVNTEIPAVTPGVKVVDADGAEVAGALTAGKQIKASAIVASPVDGGWLILGIYNGNKLVDVVVKDINAEDGTGFETVLVTVPDGATAAKALLWNSGTLKPLF